MAISDLVGSPCGHLEPIENGNRAFVPDPLPRQIDLNPELIYRLDEASRAVSTLAGVAETVPNPHLLITPFLRREAVLSSRIEGTQASLTDLFRYEASAVGRPQGDVAEVANYVTALEHGLERLDQLPICVRLANEMHEILLKGVRGSGWRLGNLRSSQVWIGAPGTPIEEATYVPPPALLLRDLLHDWENFVNQDPLLPPLIQCAMMHYQFEAIHPYVDAYFERDRAAYYDHLFRTSATGDWQAWIGYFLDGVVEQAHDALHRARRVRDLRVKMRDALQENRESANALMLLDRLFERPLTTAPAAAKSLNISTPGARGILDRLADLNIVEYHPETWPRVYVNRELMDLIDSPAVLG